MQCDRIPKPDPEFRQISPSPKKLEVVVIKDVLRQFQKKLSARLDQLFKTESTPPQILHISRTIQCAYNSFFRMLIIRILGVDNENHTE